MRSGETFLRTIIGNNFTRLTNNTTNILLNELPYLRDISFIRNLLNYKKKTIVLIVDREILI